MADPVVLKYTGVNGQHFPGVPAQDLHAADIAELGPDVNGDPWTAERLVKSGLYKAASDSDVLKTAEAERAARVKAEEAPPKKG